MTQPEYVFLRVEDARELERLRAIEQVCDAATRRRLLATGVKAGWTCLEVGPGAGSVLGWMSEVVGPTGRVAAVDISTKFLGPQQPRNVEVRQADVRTVPLPEAAFDLVHARYVLIHLSDYQTALSKMLACLKPGGWLVLEEPDFSASRGITGEAGQLASVAKVNQAIKTMYDMLGMDDALGLKLPSVLQHRGMRKLTVEYEAPLSSGGSGMATMMKMSAEQLREKYLATGAVTASDLTQYGRFTEDPESWAIYYATVAVTGQKPL